MTDTYGAPSMPDLDDLDPEGVGQYDDNDGPASDLDLLRNELSADVRIPEFTYHLKHRAGYSTVHRLDFTADDLQKWAKRADQRGAVQGAKMNALALAATNTAILKDGRRLVDEKGQPLLLTSPDMKTITGKPDAWQATRHFFGHDADLIRAGGSLTAAAGYDEAGNVQDPTE